MKQTLRMTAKADGKYESYKSVGWTDEQLVLHNLAEMVVTQWENRPSWNDAFVGATHLFKLSTDCKSYYEFLAMSHCPSKSIFIDASGDEINIGNGEQISIRPDRYIAQSIKPGWKEPERPEFLGTVDIFTGTKPERPTRKTPSHYMLLDDIESIDLVASSMTEEMFKGFCLGSIMKYRLRAGKKDDLAKEIAKSDDFEVIFKAKKHLCRT